MLRGQFQALKAGFEIQTRHCCREPITETADNLAADSQALLIAVGME